MTEVTNKILEKFKSVVENSEIEIEGVWHKVMGFTLTESNLVIDYAVKDGTTYKSYILNEVIDIASKVKEEFVKVEEKVEEKVAKIFGRKKKEVVETPPAQEEASKSEDTPPEDTPSEQQKAE